MAWAAVAAALVIAGCGGSSTSNDEANGSGGGEMGATRQSADGGGGAETVKVSADPGGALKFTAKRLEAEAGTVTFEFDNPSSTPHAFRLEGKGIGEKATKVVTKGDASLTVDLKPGTYEFDCPVGDHEEKGMKGTLTVS